MIYSEITLSAGAVEYTNCTSAESKTTHPNEGLSGEGPVLELWVT